MQNFFLSNLLIEKKREGEEDTTLKSESEFSLDSNVRNNVSSLLYKFSDSIKALKFQIENFKLLGFSVSKNSLKENEILSSVLNSQSKEVLNIQIELPQKGEIEVIHNYKIYKYIGNFLNGKLNGEGKKMNREDTIWSGIFRDGKEWDGKGKYFYFYFVYLFIFFYLKDLSETQMITAFGMEK